MKRLLERVRAYVEDPNPILVKELRSIFRTTLYIRFLYLSTSVIGALVLLIGATVIDGSVTPAVAGRVIFHTFFSLVLAVLSVVGPIYGASTITSEREAITYESLLLTGMDASRIVLGKFAATYASLALVLIALAPIAGVVFLFGGVAPTHVLVAFGSVLIALLPAVACGVAVSAHLPTSRMAILVSIGTWPFLVLFGSVFFTVYGLEQQHPWELMNPGPFWFAEALVERRGSLHTLFVAGIFPLYLIGSTVWFFLAAAIAGVRPAAEDRSTPLKFWALASLVGPVALTCVTTALSDRASAPEAFALVLGAAFFSLYFYANVFVNEPPLPPRLVQEPGSAIRRLVRRVFGPGARPTLRFSVWFMTGFLLLLLGAFAVTHALVHGANGDELVGFAFVALSMLAFGVFLVSLGTVVRLRTRRGATARAVLFATAVVLVVVPTLVALIVDSRALDDLDRELPVALMLSPLAPLVVAVRVVARSTSDAWMVLPFGVFYGVLGLALYVHASRRTNAIITQADELRAALLKRVGEAVPVATAVENPRAGGLP